MRLIRKAAMPSARLIMNRLVLMLGMLATSAHAVDGPIVKIDSGRLEGQVLPGTQPVRAFFGIPFAAPPVGSLRWREPQAVTPWPNTRPRARSVSARWAGHAQSPGEARVWGSPRGPRYGLCVRELRWQ